MKKLIFFICSLAIIITSLVTPVSAQNYIDSVQTDDVKLNCKVNLLISLDDNSVIIERNANMKVAPASLTKIMTALVVLQKEPDLNRKMTVSEEAIKSIAGTGSSTSGLKSGEEMTVYDMLCCLLIPSGNDAANALAIEYGGSIAGFVKMMNDTAKALGCKNTNFENAHGLDSPNHLTTANDLVIITKAALKYPAFETISGSYIYDLPETNMHKARRIVTSNDLINPYRNAYNKSVKGIKTGTTNNAGRCLVSYASRDGYNYLAVVMGGASVDTDGDGTNDLNQAFEDTNIMYNWAFKNLKYEIVTRQGQFVCSVPLNNCSSSDSAKLVAANEVLALVPQGNDSESVSFRPLDLPESLDAPLKMGDAVCKAEIIYAGQKIGVVDLVVAADAKRDFLLYSKSIIENITSIKFFQILFIFIAIAIVAYIAYFIIANRKRKKMREIKMVKYNELKRNTRKK
ncbi:MAG: D-alanyl-D-alanine carboxypeptidase [Clostridia bacterium]|nr:D-alanyl-D-alanine carboxypeptidase [Clostridia bacterium]